MNTFTPVKLKPVAHYVYLDNAQGNAERRETEEKAHHEGYVTHSNYTSSNKGTGRWTLDIFEKIKKDDE
ncbi:MAG: hypothetical protein V3U54_08470 [Thermodesulfobacteriota bacterium]